MNNVGFCVFGRPTKHEFKSNGLFAELKLGDGTYIEFSGNTELEKNDSLCMISRSIIADQEVVKIYYYEHAISHNKRDGGFVGVGIVFSNEKPTEKLLYSCLLALKKQALKLIDESKKFIEPRLNQDAIQLVNPDTEGLVIGQPVKRKIESISKGSSYGVKIEGNILHSLHGIVQGFISNPDFNRVEKLYVSKNTNLLKVLVGEKKILSFHRLLSYKTLFEKANEDLRNKKHELEVIKSEEKTLQNQVKNLANNIDSKNRDLEDLKKLITKAEATKESVTRDLESEKKELESLQETIEQTEQQIAKQQTQNKKSIEATHQKLEQLQVKRFNELMNEPSIREGKKAYEHDVNSKAENKIKRLRGERDSLKIELQHERNKTFWTKETIIFLSVIAALILSIGVFVGYILFDSENPKTSKVTYQTSKKQKEEKEIRKEIELGLPREYPINEFLKLTRSEIQQHKKAIDIAIAKIEDNKFEKEQISTFLNRKWNFAEVIDYNKNSIDSGLVRYLKIRNITSNTHKINNTIISSDFIIGKNIEEQTKKTTIRFGSNKREEILKQYYFKEDNIYKEMGIHIDEVKLFEEEFPELYMHFRWMVYKLSDYQNKMNADIQLTREESHKVLLKK